MRRALLFLVSLCLGLAVSSCNERAPDQPPEDNLSQPTSPANVLLALEQLYENNAIDPSQRASSYANLLVPPDRPDIAPFRFMYGLCDIECPWMEWGLEEETGAHENMLTADRRILLEFNALQEFDATMILPDREGWRVIAADSVRLSVWEGGMEITAFTASEQLFFFAPADGRWYLVEWWESLSSSMWGSFKSQFDPSGAVISEPAPELKR